jgi:hypothetical protein
MKIKASNLLIGDGTTKFKIIRLFTRQDKSILAQVKFHNGEEGWRNWNPEESIRLNEWVSR